MRSKEHKYMEEALNAVKSDNFDLMKENLDSLMLLKKPSILKDIFNKFKYLGQHITSTYGTKIAHQGLINELLLESIHNHNFEITKYLIDSDEMLIKPELDRSSTWAMVCQSNNLEMLRFLLNNSKVKNKGELVTKGLESLPEFGLPMLDFLFDKSQPHYQKFIQEFNDYNKSCLFTQTFNPFIYASKENSKLLIDFYLDNDETKKFINGRTFSNSIIVAASSDNCLEVLDYLLNDKKMPYKAYEDYNFDISILEATKTNARKVLQYLIFDMNVKLEKSLDKLLDSDNFPKNFGSFSLDQNVFKNGIDFTKELFAKRQIKEDLENNLDSNLDKQKSSKRPKI
jgi:hypothetical protein